MEKIDGRYLRLLREERGYSLREFAEMIYVSKSSVQRWEKSYVPEQPEVLDKIAEIFNISVDEMRLQSAQKFGNENPEENESNLSPEQLAELKFSAKWITIPVAFLAALCIVALVIFLV